MFNDFVVGSFQCTSKTVFMPTVKHKTLMKKPFSEVSFLKLFPGGEPPGHIPQGCQWARTVRIVRPRCNAVVEVEDVT